MMTIGTRIIHDLRGLGVVTAITENMVTITFEDGKVGKFDINSEYLSYADSGLRVYTPPKIIPAVPNKITYDERARRLSKYCTDFERHRDIFSAPFDPNKNPNVLRNFEKQASTWILVVGCGPESYSRVCSELERAGLDQPEDYVRLYTQGHAEKYDLLVPDPKIPKIDFDLGIFFGYIRLARTGRYQIGRKELALRNILKFRVLEVGEDLPRA